MTTTSAKSTTSNSAPESAPDAAPDAPPAPGKLDLLAHLLARPEGASLDDLVAATGWQPHSVRGAMAGALKKRGHTVVSGKIDGVRRWRIGDAS